MNTIEMLSQELKELAMQATDPPDANRYFPESGDAIQAKMHEVSLPENKILAFTEKLKKIPELAALDKGAVNHSPFSKGNGIELKRFTHWLIAQARRSPTENWIARLLEILAKNESTIQEIVPVWGISPIREIEIGGGIKIVPIANLPPSRTKDLYMGNRRHQYSTDPPNSHPHADAAFVKETVQKPIYEADTSEAAIKSEKLKKEMEDAFDLSDLSKLASVVMSRHEEIRAEKAERFSIQREVDELVTIVALSIDHPVFVLGQWYQHDINLPIVGRESGYSGQAIDHAYQFPISPKEYPIEDIQTLVQQYRSLSDDTKKRLRTPLVRLNEGRRQLFRGLLEGAAIDLGIAVEALLTKDKDKDETISYALRMRGTILLGGAPEQKKENYRTLRDLYNLRSTAAHDGYIVAPSIHELSERERKGRNEALEKLRAGEKLCVRLIRRIIENGHFPKSWESLMFGWDD